MRERVNREGFATSHGTWSTNRDIEAPAWSRDGKGLYVATADRGNGKIAHVTLDGRVDVVAGDLGGGDLGRPYKGGTFTVASDGRIAYTWSRPDVPADIAVATRGAATPARVTSFNDGLFAHRTLAGVPRLPGRRLRRPDVGRRRKGRTTARAAEPGGGRARL